MVHLVIKELASSAEDIIMVTSTIMKDTGGSTDVIYRPNAIRALCRIIDVGCPPLPPLGLLPRYGREANATLRLPRYNPLSVS